MRILPFAGVVALVLAAGSCKSGEKGADADWRNVIDTLGDTRKVAYVMEHASPDSVARFICDAALDKAGGCKIDTFAVAAAYAYEHYTDSALMAFSSEFDDYVANRPLPDKMKLYYMAGRADAHRLGYVLGLEYVSEIREQHKTVAEIRAEIAELRNACGEDSSTYVRFVKGFRTVLKADHGRDLPEDVYKAFVDMPD